MASNDQWLSDVAVSCDQCWVHTVVRLKTLTATGDDVLGINCGAFVCIAARSDAGVYMCNIHRDSFLVGRNKFNVTRK